MSNQLVPSGDEMNTLSVMAEHAFKSKFCEKLGGPSAIFTIMARAREIGMPILEAVMGGMNIIQGKVEISPRAMNAMIRRAGHKLEILECNALKCAIRGTRKDTAETLLVVYTIEDAKRANIYKGAWITYPDDMNFKSALSKLARRLFPDIISTSYVEGEIAEDRRSTSHQEPALPAPAESKVIDIAAPKEPDVEPVDPLIEEAQVFQLEDLIGNNSDLEQRVLDTFGVPEFKYLRQSQFNSAVKKLKLSVSAAEKEAE